MGLSRLIDGASRRHQSLREHLAAENASRPDISVATPINVDLERLEVEDAKQVVERFAHSVRPLVA